ncbi:hypothetical protein [Mesorhizobium sp. BR1-1-14]|uniref:hypothetical protein n=1 Tax=Mesorhizobium sp. BR1-1-14 TaxID=2876655 RepID=UPI001CD123F6|nr:hypothetical protein [Mesorhizobium sp. BR1-1-14]MBZ9959335.1 hypothetical protein [Mesorhizobium sp. BR1-1-14]
MSHWPFLTALPFNMWGKRPAPKPPTKHQNCRKTKAIWLLVRQGHITLREIANIGDNSPGKTVMRMRQDGVLFPDALDPKGFRMAPNASGQSEHKVYLWTNKLPAGLERRKTQRGQK